MNNYVNFSNIGIPIKSYIKTGYSTNAPLWRWERRADFCTLYYVISGNIVFSLCGKEYVCGENVIFYLSAGESALMYNTSKTEKATLYYTTFELADGKSVGDLGIARHTKDDEHKFFEIFRSLYKTRLAEGTAYKVLELSDFLRLLYGLITYKQISKSLKIDINLDKAVRYMRMNFYKPITVEELSALAGYSPSHFRRLFVECYGVSPNDYLLNYRIERAKELLVEEEGRTIDEVADILGMCNSSYFCKLFKKRTGISPHKFKKMNTKQEI